jgi:hypothetical protein
MEIHADLSRQRLTPNVQCQRRTPLHASGLFVIPRQAQRAEGPLNRSQSPPQTKQHRPGSRDAIVSGSYLPTHRLQPSFGQHERRSGSSKMRSGSFKMLARSVESLVASAELPSASYQMPLHSAKLPLRSAQVQSRSA